MNPKLQAKLRETEAIAYDTVPHDLRGALAVQKADDDQAHAERVADGEEEIEAAKTTI